jgi:hypothetical protein
MKTQGLQLANEWVEGSVIKNVVTRRKQQSMWKKLYHKLPAAYNKQHE